jgi:cation transporter-like permease
MIEKLVAIKQALESNPDNIAIPIITVVIMGLLFIPLAIYFRKRPA